MWCCACCAAAPWLRRCGHGVGLVAPCGLFLYSATRADSPNHKRAQPCAAASEAGHGGETSVGPRAAVDAAKAALAAYTPQAAGTPRGQAALAAARAALEVRISMMSFIQRR